MSYILPAIFLAPLIGVFVMLFIPEDNRKLIRQTAIACTSVSLILSIYLLFQYDYHVAGFQFQYKISWIKSFGISLHMAVDGISVPLVLLTSLIIFTGSFVALRIESRTKEFYILLLILVVGVFGVFTFLDIFFFFLAYELAVLPMYLLIGIWGSDTTGYKNLADKKQEGWKFITNYKRTSKEFAAMKLTLYLTAGSLIALIGILMMYFDSGLNSFDMVDIATKANFSPEFQKLVFPLLLIGFGCMAPMWPFHSWSPVGHAAAPSCVSMLHAGVLMKMGSYGILRLGMYMLPIGAKFWLPWVAGLCLINIIYGGLIALYQDDTKFVIGYSSSSHMGYVLLGLACLNVISITGCVLLMFAHGLVTGLLFSLVGYTYEQVHTRFIPSLGGLAKKMPFVAVCCIIAALASFGMPTMINFIAELYIFTGAWQVYPVHTVIAVIGVIISAAYMLRMVRNTYYGEMDPKWEHVKDLSTFTDRLPVLLLMGCLFVFGLFPSLLIDIINSGAVDLIDHITNATTIVAQAGMM